MNIVIDLNINIEITLDIEYINILYILEFLLLFLSVLILIFFQNLKLNHDKLQNVFTRWFSGWRILKLLTMLTVVSPDAIFNEFFLLG